MPFGVCPEAAATRRRRRRRSNSMEWLWFFPIVSLPVTAAVASASQMRHVQEGNKGYEQQQ
jgi:hypothetical protein